MGGVRRNRDAAFKARVALEAVRGTKTMAQLSGEYGVHADQILAQRKELKKRTTLDRRTRWEKRRITENGLHLEGDSARLDQGVGSGKRVTSESSTLVSNV